ncbi:MAG: FeoA family protein [FCB group bacterium]|jgi:Fe2+ transport system protein FeoA
MSLTDAPAYIKLKISAIESETEVKRKLTSIGIHNGDLLLKLNSSKIGAVLINNLSSGNSKLALGRGLADKIHVNYDG